jgi:LacI family transcriptional regulator
METVTRSGFIRKKQRYLCKECNFNFTVHHVDRKAKNREQKSHQTTILDIANVMGLAPSTVSRALQDHPDISINTRNAIKEMAVDMDYHPNLYARNFARKQTKTIGVIIPNLETAFFSTMLAGIQRIASEAGYGILICQSGENYRVEVDNVRTLFDNQVDGLLICHSMENGSFEQINSYVKSKIPIIHFYRACSNAKTSKVLAKDVEGSFQITEHLIQQGCQHLAIILGHNEFINSNKRLEGYKKALKKYTIHFDQRLVSYTDLSYKSVVQAIDNWLKLKQHPDALMCISDQSALFAMKYLKHLKMNIPKDICIAGFGNNLMGELVEPGLTTYDVNSAKIGSTAMQMLLNHIYTPDSYTPKTIKINGELVLRASTLRTTISKK